MYKISVIVPVYNVEDTLEMAFKSLYNQTIGFENLEIIFVDDCSTDNSFKIIENLSATYKNVFCYSTEENSGSGGKPRNIGLEKFSSDYLMFFDPDDYLLDDACEFLYDNIINSKNQIISGNFSIKEKGIEKKINWDHFKNFKYGLIHVENILENIDLIKIMPSLWSKIFHKDLIKENNIKFLENVPGEDLYFVVNCLLKAKGITFFDKEITKYILREDTKKSLSISRVNDKQTLMGYIYAYNKLFDLLNEYEENISWLSARHLAYGSLKLALSETSSSDKLEFIYNARKLYEIFYLEKLGISKEFKPLIDLIHQKEYFRAIESLNLVNFQLNDIDKNLLKDIPYYILVENFNNIENYQEIFDKINSLKNKYYNIQIIDLNYLSKQVTCLSFINRKLTINNLSIEDLFEADMALEKNENEIILRYIKSNFYLKFDNEIEFISYLINYLSVINEKNIFVINLTTHSLDLLSKDIIYIQKSKKVY